MEINVGMIVWLKTGGPSMTVKSYYKDVTCTWFVENEVKEHVFTADQLTDKDPNPKRIGSFAGGNAKRDNRL